MPALLHRPRLRAALVAATLALSGVTAVTATTATAPAASAAPIRQSQDFAFTNAEDTYWVPTGVTALTITAQGGSGQAGSTGGEGAQGGIWGHAEQLTETISVAPGDKIDIWVASDGGQGGAAYPGYNGGAGGRGDTDGASGGTGGGATVVLRNSAPVAIAGGGGGGGGGGWLTSSGGDAGDAGPATGGLRGYGGTGWGAGAGGTGNWNLPAGQQGANGQWSTTAGGAGGGGGGMNPLNSFGGGLAGDAGTWGGGGGGGGAGGTSWGLATNTTYQRAPYYGNGTVTLSWAAYATTTLTSSVNPADSGQSVTLTATVASSKPDAPAPTGTVAFERYDFGAATVLAVVPVVNGTATWTSVAGALGTVPYVAVYSGDSSYAVASSSALNQVVIKPARRLAVTPDSPYFGQKLIGSTTHLLFTVTNKGTESWSTYAGGSDNQAFQFAGGTCVRTVLTTGMSCTVDVTFTPPALSTYTGSITLATNWGQNLVLNVSGTGIGVPKITSISRTSGTKNGGTEIVIMGTNLTQVTGIKFGNVDATLVTCTRMVMCRAASPAGTGTVDVRVTNAAGTSAPVAADRFTYTA